MRSLPKRMITQTVTLQTFDDTLTNGEDFLDDVTLKNVKIDDGLKRLVTQTGVELVGNAVMFVDARISKPTMTSKLLSSSSKIIENIGTDEEQEYMIVAPNPCKDNNKIHHWEVMLE